MPSSWQSFSTLPTALTAREERTEDDRGRDIRAECNRVEIDDGQRVC